jgi:CDP-2,3-bis-(O-geranylgeranyl)-sn-glycerol synthase
MQIILETLWVFLPAIVANMAPVFAARYGWLSALDVPLDGGKTLRGRQILGDHKTVRGLGIGAFFGLLAGMAQFGVQRTIGLSSPTFEPYVSLSYAAFVAVFMSVGALAGDAIKSFVKRQLHIAPGKSWPPFDQVDFVIGAYIVTWWVAPISLFHFVVALVFLGIGSFATSVVGVHIRIKKSL